VNKAPRDVGEALQPTGYTFLDRREREMQIRREGNFVCDLSHLAFAVAAGQDAASFLHGQLTNDLEGLAADAWQMSGYCSPKGRLKNILRIHRAAERIVLQSNASVMPAAIESLRRFVLRSKLELRAAPDIGSFGVVGMACCRSLEALTGSLPEHRYGVREAGGAVILCHSLSPHRFQVVGSEARLASIRNAMSSDWPNIGSWAWALHDIECGLPAILDRTAEKFVPHSLNLDLLGGVSFQKGCYPGQEIVARMEYLGRPKSRMIRAQVHSGAPAPGDKVYATGHEQSIGMVVDAAPSERGYELLTTLRVEYLEKGDIRLGTTSGAILSRLELPYELNRPG
jgi:folate-binding protein YgfZ